MHSGTTAVECSSSNNSNIDFQTIPGFHFWEYTPKNRKQKLKWIFVHSRSLQRYSQEPKEENNPSVLWCLSGSTKWDVHRTEENGCTQNPEKAGRLQWTNLEDIMLNEINQPQKHKCYMIPYMGFLESSHSETLRYQNIPPQNMPLWRWDLLSLNWEPADARKAPKTGDQFSSCKGNLHF